MHTEHTLQIISIVRTIMSDADVLMLHKPTALLSREVIVGLFYRIIGLFYLIIGLFCLITDLFYYVMG